MPTEVLKKILCRNTNRRFLDEFTFGPVSLNLEDTLTEYRAPYLKEYMVTTTVGCRILAESEQELVLSRRKADVAIARVLYKEVEDEIHKALLFLMDRRREEAEKCLQGALLLMQP